MRRFAVLACLCLASLSAFAQTPAPPKMTWLRYYQVERGKDADFLFVVRERLKPALDELQKNGKIVTWGVAEPITMTSDPWTHVLYIVMPDWSSAAALPKRTGALALPAIATRDTILRHLVQSATPPKAAPKYIVADTHRIKTGREGDALQLFNEWAKPMFLDLAANGHVDLWGFSSNGVVVGINDTGWTHMVWYFLHDLASVEAVIEINAKVEPRTMQGYWLRLQDMSEIDARREQVWQIVTPQ